MTLGKLKSYFESRQPGAKFQYSLSHPFSWRGDYSQVAFSVDRVPSTREHNLKRIDEALTETFKGYKGGDFKFDENTPVNFEDQYRDYTDGRYTEELISSLLDHEVVESPEERLVKLAFSPIHLKDGG